MNLGIRSPMRHSPLQFFSQSAAAFTTSSGDKTVTLTPAVGDLIIVFCATTASTPASTDPAPFDTNSDGNGGAAHYAKLSGSIKASSADELTVWARDTAIGSASSTDFSGGLPTNTGGGIVVVCVRGARHFGATAIRSGQVAPGSNHGGGSAPGEFYPAAPLPSNMQLGAVFNADNPATLDPPAGWTERHDVGFTVPTTGLEVATLDYGSTLQTLAWGSSSGSAYCSVQLELDGAP